MLRALSLVPLFALVLPACVDATEETGAEDARDATINDRDTKEDSVNFVEDNSWDSEAVLRFVNAADYDDLRAGAGISSWPARAIAEARKPITTLAALDALDWVGPITFAKLRGHATEAGFGPTIGEEYPPDGEQAAIDETIQTMGALMLKKYMSGDMKRGQHAKAHGCARATFRITDVPAAQRIGLFARPGEYRSILRFSNGDSTVKADNEKDVRGFAIKVLGVEGPKVLAEEATAKTQDFLLINHPTLMTRNVLRYAELTRAINSGGTFSILGFFLSLDPTKWELRGLTTLLSMISHDFANPLASQYWSTTPSALGAGAVKYSARPCTGVPDTVHVPDDAGPNFVGEALSASLASTSACFELMVQPQTDPRAMPIEDPTVEWKESKSAFVPVARIEIAAQPLMPATECENLSFTPWHSLEAHKPLGGINRARKAVYKVISVMRHTRNGAPRTEPN